MMTAHRAATLLVAILMVAPFLPMLQTSSAGMSFPLASHNPISITGNSGFTGANGVVAGDGTSGNPYIIENWTINASTADGISVQSTDKYFVIRNCTIGDGAYQGNSYSGISLSGASRGAIINNTITRNLYGIYLTNSDNITISNNSISYSTVDGIRIINGDDNEVSDNALFENDGGFFSNNGYNNSVVHNEIYNNTDGIRDGFVSSRYLDNVVRDHSGIGVSVNGQHNTFNDTTIVRSAGAYGIRINSAWNTVSNGNISDNAGHGISVIGDRAVIDGNTVLENDIEVLGTTGVIVRDNHLSDSTGLVFTMSFDGQVYGNSIRNTTGTAITVGGGNDTVRENIIDAFTGEGITIATNNNQISNNSITNGLTMAHTAKAISCDYDFNLMDNNTIENNDAGIIVTGYRNAIWGNSVGDTYHRGIYINGGSDNSVHGNRLYNNSEGVRIQGNGDQNNVSDNEILNNRVAGILAQTTLSQAFIGNHIDDNPIGIWINQSSTAIRIDGNIITDSTTEGLLLFKSDTHFILNNSFVNNPTGLKINDSDTVYIYNNSIVGSDIVGIELERDQFDRAYNNLIVDCAIGLELANSNNTRVYNNYFNNTMNYKVTGGTGNIWNTPRVLGTNIVLGPYLGGSFWSDYAGTDADADWIGDTAVPHGPGDNFPLLQPPDLVSPNLTDLTSGDPTTGDQFTLKASAQDNINIRDVEIRYRFDQLVQVNKSMGLLTGRMFNGTFSYTVTAPSRSFDFYYNISTSDLYGNINWTGWKKLQVKDNDAPSLADNTKAAPTTGDNATFNASASDNVNMSKVSLSYRFDGGAWNTKDMALTGNVHLYNLTMPTNGASMEYKLSAFDNSSNSVVLPVVKLSIRDDDMPALADLSGSNPRTGQAFEIKAQATDNVNVSKVETVYSFDGGAPVKAAMTSIGQDRFNLTINVSDSATVLRYNISATDPAKNRAEVQLVTLNVLDVISPVIEDDSGTPENGQGFTVICRVYENIAVAVAEVEYWFDDGAHTTKSLLPSYSYTFPVPGNATILHYTITAFDTANNTDNTSRSVVVSDKILPTVKDSTPQPTTGDELEFSFNVTDNRGPGPLSIEYWFDGGTRTKADLSKPVKVLVPSNALRMFYNVTVNDTSGNSVKAHFERKVIDNDKPTLKDLSGIPATGQPMLFNFSYSDNTGVTAAYLVYRFDAGAVVNLTYTGAVSVKAPDTATYLNYTMTVLDAGGNTASISKGVPVPDVTGPVITDGTSAVVRTGEKLQFQAYVWDNLGVKDVSIAYSFDGGTKTFLKLQKGTDSYILEVTVPSTARSLEYTMTAMDVSGLTGSMNKTVVVKDSILPTVMDRTANATTGEALTFRADISDNIGVTKATIDYWFNDDQPTSATFVDGMTVQVPPNARKLSYIIKAKDAAGNERKMQSDKLVKDNDPPSVTDTTSGDPKGGKEFTITGTATDNIAMSEVALTYWYTGQTERTTVAMSKVGSTYSVVLKMKNNGELHYTIKALDSSGNYIETQEKTLRIKTAAESPFNMTMMLAVVVLIIVIVVVVVIIIVRHVSRIAPTEAIVEERPVQKAKPRSKPREEAFPEPVKKEPEPVSRPTKKPEVEKVAEPKETARRKSAWEPAHGPDKETQGTGKAWGSKDKKKPPKDAIDEILES